MPKARQAMVLPQPHFHFDSILIKNFYWKFHFHFRRQHKRFLTELKCCRNKRLIQEEPILPFYSSNIDFLFSPKQKCYHNKPSSLLSTEVYPGNLNLPQQSIHYYLRH